MTRQRRLDVPGVARHIVQRGNNRQVCFLEYRDRYEYLEALKACAEREEVAIHAWVLMSNHVHLLVTPDKRGAVSRMMQAIGRRYVRSFNLRRQRTGTLWEGRFRSTLVENGQYLLACYRYIELNPVRAKLVGDAGEYRWSSYAANALGQHDSILRPHPEYLALGTSEDLRLRTYREWVASGICPDELEAIRHQTRLQRSLGSETFQTGVESDTGLSARPGRRGQPRKKVL